MELGRKGCDMFRQSSKVSRLASNIMKWYTVQEKMVVFSAADIHAKIMDDSYRVTDLVGYELSLIWIWEVLPSCLGSC